MRSICDGGDEMTRDQLRLTGAVAGAACLILAMVWLNLASCSSGGKAAPAADVGEAIDADAFKVKGVHGEPPMRVRIAAGSTTAQFDGASGYWVLPADLVSARQDAQRVQGPLAVLLAGSEWVVRDGAGRERRVPADRDLEIAPETDDGKGDALVTVSPPGLKYPGKFRLSASKTEAPLMNAASAAGPTSSGKAAGKPASGAQKGRGGSSGYSQEASPMGGAPFDIIEYVGLETYLPGVVCKELFSDWNLRTYQVQAIAARTYAIHERLRSMAAGKVFDVESTQRDQVYGGATESSVALEGVKSTRGMIVEYNGTVLRTYYSSTCGGRVASARDTWPTGKGFEFNLAAPLQAKPREFACQRSPLFTWTVERERAELVQRIKAFGVKNGYAVRNMTDLVDIKATKFNEVGRAQEYRLVQPDGKWWTLKAEELRIACNTEPTGPKAGDEFSDVVPGSIGAAPAKMEDLRALPPITRKSRVNSGDMEFAFNGSQVLIKGRGFGHGVGMCQYCAKGFSEQGYSAPKILEIFYPGAKVVKAY
jgi:stage II sporulation protein D